MYMVYIVIFIFICMYICPTPSPRAPRRGGRRQSLSPQTDSMDGGGFADGLIDGGIATDDHRPSSIIKTVCHRGAHWIMIHLKTRDG